MDAAKEILLYYLEALSDAAEEVAQVGRMSPAVHDRLTRAHGYVATLRNDRVVGGFAVHLDATAPGYPTQLPKPAPRLLTLLSAPIVLLANPEGSRLAFHDNAWRLVEEARYFMQAVDLGWVRVEVPLAAPAAKAEA